MFYVIGFGCLATFFLSCNSQSIPPKAKAVTNFEVDKYLGNWYEIARIDFKHEKNLDNTTANYAKNDDGSIKVVNKGYNFVKNKWEEAHAKAKFRGDENIAELKVSFFGPFYSGYNVIALDENYQYALVAGKDLDNLWILAREKTIPDDVKENYLAIAQEVGYDTNRLIWIKHDKN